MFTVFSFTRFLISHRICVSSTLKTDCWGLSGWVPLQMMEYPFVVLHLPGRMQNVCVRVVSVHFSIIVFFFFFLFSFHFLMFVYVLYYLLFILSMPRVHCPLRVDLTRNKFTIISQLHLLIVCEFWIGISEWFICLALLVSHAPKRYFKMSTNT